MDVVMVAEIRAKYEDKLQEVNELKDRVSIVQKRVEVLDKLVEGVLSTAQPCLGGQIPELGVLEAVFYRPPPPPVAQPLMARNRMFKTAAAPGGAVFGAVQECSALDAAPMRTEMARVVEPAQHALSTEFMITKPAAVPSDGAEHKTNMKNVSPGERFSCSLGVDAALRVEYKPVKKYHEQVGLINKSSSNVHEQVIVVKNSRAQPVLLTIKEQVPRSTDEKIKVRLIAPAVSQTEEVANNGEGDLTAAAELPKEGCRMKNGILEWTITLQDGKTAELHVKWAVDHPKDEVVEFVERY
ncbi:hypothetical protein TELCIR_17996 [Teladorsagia circumcincta]|uniref:DUF4139 domain-containing protein n=1 Tax=Teladorsagia circumcincta TaxID=45464 RepID=A0A2G9TR79_TELCI|nr:hypothetical protein TELCIR_17996 [Teladorsagia circumcincta]